MNIIFDFDGTLCDSLDVTIDIINNFLTRRGRQPITKEEMLQDGFKGLVKSREIPKYMIPFLVIYGQRQIGKHIKELKMFPGLKEEILDISKGNYLSIVTSNSGRNVRRFLSKNGLDGVFDDIQTDFSMFGKEKKIEKLIRKHHLKRRETYFIGDETRDIEAARKVGIKVVAVTWGFEKKTSLQKAKPDLLISRTIDLRKIS